MSSTISHLGELSRDGVFIHDLDHKKFKYVNKALADIFEVTPALILEQPKVLLPFIRSDDSVHMNNRYHDLLKDKVITNAEFALHLSNGRVKFLCLDAFVLDKENYITGFLKDITRSREHEDYIINYGAKKDTLLDMMAHNLYGPLALSQNILTWMQKTYKDNVPAEIFSQLQLIESNTQECLDIINDFLREEHMESEHIFVKKTRFDLLDRIAVTLEKLMATNKNKKFKLVTNLKNLHITTDSVKFFQIIHNLLSNAIKFTPEHGMIEIIVEEHKNSFIIRIKDNGIGIPPEMHPMLFEKNSRASRKGLNKEFSSGMGLYIVKTLVTLLDGKVYFESEENKGSTFSVEFPKE